jgi:hypothetical protein
MDAAIESISATVQQLPDAYTAKETIAGRVSSHSAFHVSFVDMQRKFDAFTMSMNVRVDQLNAVCANLESANSSLERSVQSDLHATDRKAYIIICGIKGDRDATVWGRQVSAVVHFITDHAVDVEDMFHVVQCDANKCRLLLAKVRVVCDTSDPE